MAGDTAKAKPAYQDFFTLWKDGDPDVPILKQAKTEYAKRKPESDVVTVRDAKAQKPAITLSDSVLEASCMVSGVLFERIARLL
jgi:hypothetical protein